ncbi:hypothetical protein HY837_03240 [archaeon]|nr:hypothetical protein [archaeon]
MAKSKLIQLRITEQEKNELEALAKIQGFSKVSDYLREIVFKNRLASEEKVMIIRENEDIINLLNALNTRIRKM